MPNPTPLPRVILLPCRKCGAERHHLGTGVCWDCMTPAERGKYTHNGSAGGHIIPSAFMPWIVARINGAEPAA